MSFFVVEIRGFIGSDLDASVIAEWVNMFTKRSVSPQGFVLQSNGAIDIAQSPRIEIKKNPRNIEFVFFICGGDWFDTSEHCKTKIPIRFAIKPLYQFLNSFVNSLFHFSASSHCGE